MSAAARVLDAAHQGAMLDDEQALALAGLETERSSELFEVASLLRRRGKGNRITTRARSSSR